MKIVSVVGARPQFIKCAAVSREIRKDHTEILVHTGQHYDPEMSDIFFEELEIPRPDYNLDVGSGSHGKQTGEILRKIEEVLVTEKPDYVLVTEKPDYVLVYGDTNSTLGGALAAAKLHIPVAHVEAGFRSFDRTMPEEINRVLTDHISDMLFCPTQAAVDNLAREGITRGVYLTGDVMADVLAYNREIAKKKSRILETLGLAGQEYCVMTVHRASNPDSRENLSGIIRAVGESGKTVVFPVHPQTRKYLQEYGLLAGLPENIRLIEPVGYLDMIRLMESAWKILTVSGGMQKEAYMLGVPCVTLRENTEWGETVEAGWTVLVGADREKIVNSLLGLHPENIVNDLYGHQAAKRIATIIG